MLCKVEMEDEPKEILNWVLNTMRIVTEDAHQQESRTTNRAKKIKQCNLRDASVQQWLMMMVICYIFTFLTIVLLKAI